MSIFFVLLSSQSCVWEFLPGDGIDYVSGGLIFICFSIWRKKKKYFNILRVQFSRGMMQRGIRGRPVYLGEGREELMHWVWTAGLVPEKESSCLLELWLTSVPVAFITPAACSECRLVLSSVFQARHPNLNPKHPNPPPLALQVPQVLPPHSTHPIRRALAMLSCIQDSFILRLSRSSFPFLSVVYRGLLAA